MNDDISPVESEPSSIQSTPVDSSPAPESGSQTAPQSVPQSAPTAGPWEAFKRLPEFQGQDDRAIAARLYTAMEREKAASRALAQYQQVLPYAQEYITYRPEFDAWRKSQQQAQLQAQQQQAPQPEKPKWWNPPQVRESSRRYLIRDEEGREVIDPNAPITAREELFEYQRYKADFAKKFLENPEDALGPMVQEMASKQAQEIIQQQLEKSQNEQFVTSIEEQNRDWLFDKETGNVTPEGLLVHKYVEEARERGIKGPQARWEYAIAMTERDLLARTFDEQQASQNQIQQSVQQLMQQARTAPSPAPAPAPQPQPQQPDLAQQNLQYLRREASRNPSRSAGAAATDPRTPRPKRSFAEMLKDEASSKGLI